MERRTGRAVIFFSVMGMLRRFFLGEASIAVRHSYWAGAMNCQTGSCWWMLPVMGRRRSHLSLYGGGTIMRHRVRMGTFIWGKGRKDMAFFMMRTMEGWIFMRTR